MIRQFEKRDMGRIMQIWLNSNMEAHSFVPTDYWLKNYEPVKLMIVDAEVYVFEYHNMVIGFAGMTEGYLAGLFVDALFRSNGVGKALLECLKMIYPVIRLHVYEKNTGAVRFYKREGFRVDSCGVDEATGEREYMMTWKKGEENIDE